MRRSTLILMTLCFGFVVCIANNPAGAADKKAKQSQLSGTVHMLNKDTSTITVRKGSAERQILYSADTKWKYGTESSNKPSSLDELKENWRINCKGTFDGAKLAADTCYFHGPSTYP